MLRDYFDQIYVINLDSRKDRLDSVNKEFQRIGAPFTRVAAVDGHKENVPAPGYADSNDLYWNAGAAGLLKSTEKVLKHAIANRYNKILICEDDVEFHPDINNKMSSLRDIPRNWQMFLFGAHHLKAPEPITENLAKVGYAFCLHCYAVNGPAMEYYLHLVQEGARELDRITAEFVQPAGHTYCFTENMAWQKPSFSDIQKQPVNYFYLKRPDLW